MRKKLTYAELEKKIRSLEEQSSRGQQAEDALATSRIQMSDAMDLARIVYWTVDPKTQEFIFNDAFYALYATTAEREGGYRMTREEYGKRFIYPDDLWRFAELVKSRENIKDLEFYQDFEHRMIRRDGEVRDLLVRIHLVKDAENRLIKHYGANQDITERKRAEEEREMLIRDLQEALSNVKALSGMLPICSSCKKIRDDQGYWNQIESYIKSHSEADFSHSICPECAKKLYPEYFDKED